MPLRDVWSKAMDYLGLRTGSECGPGDSTGPLWSGGDVLAEYLVVDGNATADELQDTLNAAALDGWRVGHVLPRSEGSAWLLMERHAVADASVARLSSHWPPPN